MRNPGADPVKLTQELVSIASVNPDLVPGANGESAIADFCAGWLSNRGLEVHRLESRPGRPSIVGIARGAGDGPSLMLNGHYDTVSLAGYDGDPLDPRVDDDRLYGRGSFDMKGGLAAAMVAAANAVGQCPRGDVIVACVADEEYSSWGTTEVLRHFTADAAIVTEPSHLELTLAHKGFAWLDVVVEGRAAHGSRPEFGIDAIAKAGRFLTAIEEWSDRLIAGPKHPFLGTGSVHASVIRGGVEASSYPAECRITIERRTVPGETGDSVRDELAAILGGIATAHPGFLYRVEPGLVRSPFEADPEAPIVQIVRAAAERQLERPLVVRGEPFWTDCALIQDAGIPSLLIGPDGAGAHAATEWVDITSIRTLTAILIHTIEAFCD